MENKLKRSRTDRMIAGVCGGLAKFLNVDSTLIRFFWFILMFVSDDIAWIAYIVCMFVIPEESKDIYNGEYQEDIKDSSRINSSLFIGLILIVIGAYLLVKKIWPEFVFKFLRFKQYWPVLLILLGIYIIFNRNKDNN